MKKISVGRFYRSFATEIYCLSHVGYGKVALMKIDMTNIWSTPVQVNDTSNINPQEWYDIQGSVPGEFIEVERISEIKFKDKEQETYECGDRFFYDRGDYILSQYAPGEVAMISLSTGNRFIEGIKVHDVGAITAAEMNQVCNGEFSLFKKWE